MGNLDEADTGLGAPPGAGDEERRASTLRRILRAYDVLDSPPEQQFDDLVELIARRFGATHAQLSIRGVDHVYLKASTENAGRCFDPELTFCAAVADSGKVLVVEDAVHDPDWQHHPFVGPGQAMSYLGAPLMTPEGVGIGAVCVWGNEPRQFTGAEVEAMREAAAHMMTVLDQRRANVERDRDRQVLAATGRVLDMIVSGASLASVLTVVAESIQAALPETLASIQLLRGDRLHAVAGPDIPDPYLSAIDGLPIGPAAGSCGTAAYLRRPAIASDIATDARWIPYRTVALANGLRSCWSVPIIGADGVLGTVALYGLRPQTPTPEELTQLDRWVNLTELAITRQRDLGQLRRAATHDALTGLLNRTEALDLLTSQLDDGRPLAALFLDLDQFRFVNDSLGHDVGDQFLRRAADRLRQSVRSVDSVARLGGDEFLIICPDLTTAAAEAVGRRILSALNRPMTVNGHTVSLSASIGIAVAEGRSEARGTDLVRDADLAMYNAKGTGRNSVAVFGTDMRARAGERLTLEAELKVALLAGELDCYYQPTVDMRTGEVRGMEALVRWHSPTRGLVSPDAFISLAEESGLITEIGDYVLRRACTQLSRLRSESAVWDGMRVWVNVAARQLALPTFPQTVADILAFAGLPPKCLGLEVTERSFLGDIPRVRESLEAVRHTGVSIAIDDFGTGYSSLAVLKDLPLDALKIDRRFVADPGSDDVVSLIVALGHALGIPVLAEGVEGPEQLDRMRALGCTYGQGFLWAPPMPLDDLTRYVRQASTHLRPTA